MKRLLIGGVAALLSASAAAGTAGKGEAPAGGQKPPAAAKPAASPATLKLVRYFLDTPTGELNAEWVPRFLEVDPETLPKKLRAPYQAKREELLALKRIADGNKKPPVRRLGMDEPPPCTDPMEGARGLWILQNAGYGEIEQDEELRLMSDTKCTECELEAEFSLKRLAWVKGKERRMRYFLHTKDPLMALIAGYRAGRNKPFGTAFFGIGGPHCH